MEPNPFTSPNAVYRDWFAATPPDKTLIMLDMVKRIIAEVMTPMQMYRWVELLCSKDSPVRWSSCCGMTCTLRASLATRVAGP